MKYILVISMVVALGAGCASQTAEPASVSSSAAPAKTLAIDPCALITKDEAAALLEKPVQEPLKASRNTFPFGDSCTYGVAWKQGDPVQGVARNVEVIVTTDREGFSAKDWYERTKRGSQEVANMGQGAKAPTEVVGLGDDAYEDMVGLHVLKGNVLLFVRVGALSDLKSDRAREAAEKALSRL